MNEIITLLFIVAVLLAVLLYFVVQMYLLRKPAALKAEYGNTEKPFIKRMGGLGTLIYQESPEMTKIRKLESRVDMLKDSVQLLDRALAAILIDVVKLKRKNGETGIKTDAKSCVSTDDKK